MTRCGPKRGELDTQQRKALPSWAFGLPEARKYPLYVIDRGEVLPDREHAIDAKARATQQHDRGALSAYELGRVVAAADRVLALCPGPGAADAGGWEVKRHEADGSTKRRSARNHVDALRIVDEMRRLGGNAGITVTHRQVIVGLWNHDGRAWRHETMPPSAVGAERGKRVRASARAGRGPR